MPVALVNIVVKLMMKQRWLMNDKIIPQMGLLESPDST